MTSDRVQPSTEESSQQEIKKGFWAKGEEDDGIVGKANKKIRELPETRFLWLDHERSNCVEHNLKEYEKEFGKAGLKNSPFDLSRDIDVDTNFALITMVFEVVSLERDGSRNSDRHVGKQREDSVPIEGLERQIVGTLMKREHEHVVTSATNGVGG